MFYADLPPFILMSWKMTRELSTQPRTPARTKMRIMEKYARLIVISATGNPAPSDDAIYTKATEIFNAERNAAVQPVGNLLEDMIAIAQLYISENRLTVAATDKVEDVFKYLTGTEANVETKVAAEGCSTLFNRLVNQTLAFLRINDIEMPRTLPAALARGFSPPAAPSAAPAPAVTVPAPAPTPAETIRAQRAAFLQRFSVSGDAVPATYTTAGVATPGTATAPSAAASAARPSQRPTS
jgi:hypothetical protein